MKQINHHEPPQLLSQTNNFKSYSTDHIHWITIAAFILKNHHLSHDSSHLSKMWSMDGPTPTFSSHSKQERHNGNGCHDEDHNRTKRRRSCPCLIFMAPSFLARWSWLGSILDWIISLFGMMLNDVAVDQKMRKLLHNDVIHSNHTSIVIFNNTKY